MFNKKAFKPENMQLINEKKGTRFDHTEKLKNLKLVFCSHQLNILDSEYPYHSYFNPFYLIY